MPRDGMPASQDFPVFAVYAKPPEGSEALLAEIFLGPNRAAHYVFAGIMEAVGAKIIEGIEKDEQISLLFTSGNDDINTSASLAIQSQGSRRVWEFHVEKRWAPRTSPAR